MRPMFLARMAHFECRFCRAIAKNCERTLRVRMVVCSTRPRAGQSPRLAHIRPSPGTGTAFTLCFSFVPFSLCWQRAREIAASALCVCSIASFIHSYGRTTLTRTVLGIVGGSGLYDIPALKDVHWEDVRSPWGSPSDRILFAELDGLPIRFLPRHGRGHKVPPSAIDFRANIDALKRAGVTDLVSVSACGSLKEELAPGHFVLVDQFID